MAKILVVDDNYMIRDVLRLVLQSAGHAVDEAADGDIALQSDLSGFDLVVTDLYMPHVSGFEVISEAVAAGVRTMAVSGGDRMGSEDPLVTALDLGAVLALRKPFSPMQILQGVTECLADNRPCPRVIEYGRA